MITPCAQTGIAERAAIGVHKRHQTEFATCLADRGYIKKVHVW